MSSTLAVFLMTLTAVMTLPVFDPATKEGCKPPKPPPPPAPPPPQITEPCFYLGRRLSNGPDYPLIPGKHCPPPPPPPSPPPSEDDDDGPPDQGGGFPGGVLLG